MEFRIEVPEGYEIDSEKSTFEKIVFKKIEDSLPSKWEDLKSIQGCHVKSGSYCVFSNSVATVDMNKNIFVSEGQAEASIALAQLSQLVKVYRKGWEPDWKDTSQEKFYVANNKGFFIIDIGYTFARPLSFKDLKTAKLFLKNFRSLIEKAAPLLFL